MRILTVAFAVLSILIIGGYSQRTGILELLIRTGMETRLGADQAKDLGDGLHIALCGAGGPMPAPRASGPCVAVIAGERLFVVDVGTDSPRNLGRMSYQVGGVEAVFLTHFHSDHIDGLGELATIRWAGGDNESPLPVYGPNGVQRVVNGFNETYAQDFVYRHDHHGDLVAPLKAAGLTARPFPLPEIGELATVLESDGLKVEALAVDHFPVSPAVGYRFSYQGRTVMISGDTGPSENLQNFSQGVDILVHEALAPNLIIMMEETSNKIGNAIFAKIAFDIRDYHTSPIQAAEIASNAEVGHLLYYHIVPPLVIPGQSELFLDGADDVFENYTIGIDGVSFSLPAGSDEIIKTRDGL